MPRRSKLPKPLPGSLVYETKDVYACLANEPLTPGHVVVVWKKKVADLHFLNRREYERLMDAVDLVRTALLRALRVEKVYLIYMDEAGQVHWHLVPRYKLRGPQILLHVLRKPARADLARRIREEVEKLI